MHGLLLLGQMGAGKGVSGRPEAVEPAQDGSERAQWCLSLHQALRLTQGFGTPISVRGSFSLTKGAHRLPWREVGDANKQSRERMRSFLLAGHLQSARGALLPASGDKNGFCGKQDHPVCYETAGSSQQRSDWRLTMMYPSPRKAQQKWTGNSGQFIRDPVPWYAWWKLSQDTVSAAEKEKHLESMCWCLG